MKYLSSIVVDADPLAITGTKVVYQHMCPPFLYHCEPCNERSLCQEQAESERNNDEIFVINNLG